MKKQELSLTRFSRVFTHTHTHTLSRELPTSRTPNERGVWRVGTAREVCALELGSERLAITSLCQVEHDELEGLPRGSPR